MDLEQMIGFTMVFIIVSASIFYSLGYNAGRKDGYLKGRIAGMNIGKRTERSR
jgi:hypothetical protein